MPLRDVLSVIVIIGGLGFFTYQVIYGDLTIWHVPFVIVTGSVVGLVGIFVAKLRARNSNKK